MRERVDKLVSQSPHESTGSVKLGGKSLDYAVQAAFLPVVAEGFEAALGEPIAAVMATSYVLKDADARERPVCFAFNGGPGSASIWLHLGALGPKRVVVPDDGSMASAPYAVSDNPHSWFEHFDLVFIDPPHTGWSTTASAEARKKMLSVDGDVERPRRRRAALADAPQALGLAGLPGRRELRHDARRRDGRQAAELGRRALRPDPGLVRDGPAEHRLRAAQRPAVRALPAGVRQRLAVPRPPEGRPREVTCRRTRRRRGLRRRGLRRGPACRRAPRRQAALHASPGASPSSPACRRRWSKRRTCASTTRATSSRRCARKGCIVGRLDARATGPMAASRRSRDGSSIPASRRSCPPTRWRRWATSASSSAWPPTRATRCSRSTPTRRGTGTAASDKGNSYATTSPDLARALRRNPHLKVLRRQRPLRPGHALQRERLVAGPARRAGRRAGARHAPLLRRRPHDVHARRRPEAAEGRSRELAGGLRPASAGARYQPSASRSGRYTASPASSGPRTPGRHA